MLNIGVLVSGGGSNLQALINAQESGRLKSGHISVVVSSRDNVYALERACKHNIPSVVLSRKELGDRLSDAIYDCMIEYKVDIIVYAGFLSVLEGKILYEYKDRMINVHPSLLPSFCGKGCYGLRVHEAALERGVKITGATVHFVNEIVDGGRIILQKAVFVKPNDTPESLQKRVMEEAEHIILPDAVELVCAGVVK